MRQHRRCAVLASIALLAGCVTAGSEPGPERLRGCWIERRGDETLTLRWFPDAEAPGSWRGDLLTYTPGQEPSPLRFQLSPSAGENEGQQFGWAACQIEEPHGPPCRRVVFGAGRAQGEGDDWMELRVAGERLTFAYAMAEQQMVLFDGARDGCD